MCQALLSASNAVFHFILTPFGLKKLDYLPKVTQVSNTNEFALLEFEILESGFWKMIWVRAFPMLPKSQGSGLMLDLVMLTAQTLRIFLAPRA